VNTESGRSSSSSQVPAGVTLDALNSEMAVDISDVTTRKRNRSIVVSDKYSQLIEYEVAPGAFQSWISSASATSASYGTEAGRRTADFNIRRVARSNIQPVGSQMRMNPAIWIFGVIKPSFLRISGLTRRPVVREVSRIPERSSRQCALGTEVI
jgi:hypothetical protein